MLNIRPQGVKRRPKSVQVDHRTWKPQSSEKFRAVEEYFVALDTAVSLSCLLLFRHGEYKQLVEKEIDPGQYNDPFRFRDDFAAVSFLRKNRFLETGIDTRAVALDSFRASEEHCRVTNLNLKNNVKPENVPAYDWLLNAVRRKIALFLQDFDPDSFAGYCGWGPGVSTAIKGKNTSGSRKFLEERGITRDCHQLFAPILLAQSDKWLSDGEWEFQTGNMVITVPKNAKTDRTIAIEPGLNIWIQKGIGKLIRSRLRYAGYDLNSSDKNRFGALKGASTGLVATVDFSAASDSISVEVVNQLLPTDWFSVLDSARSHYYTLDGQTHLSHKFSSMGNGFTFELESLIFLSVALVAVCHLKLPTKDVCVFGDDIIIPVEAVALYRDLCAALGFTVNTRKSFSTGYFRESCGSYYFGTLCCKPFFLKEELARFKHIYRFANEIRALSHRRNNFYGCDARFLPLHKYLCRILPPELLHYGSKESGDSCIHQNFDVAQPRKCRHQIEGYLHTGWSTRPVNAISDHGGLFLSRLRTLAVTDRSEHEDLLEKDSSVLSESRGFGNEDSLRAVVKYSFKKSIFVAQWYDFGPWF